MARHRGLPARIHGELLANRQEKQVSLPVNPLGGEGKVKALYEAWGYEEVSQRQPTPDGPVLAAMLRAVRVPASGG